MNDQIRLHNNGKLVMLKVIFDSSIQSYKRYNVKHFLRNDQLAFLLLTLDTNRCSNSWFFLFVVIAPTEKLVYL